MEERAPLGLFLCGGGTAGQWVLWCKIAQICACFFVRTPIFDGSFLQFAQKYCHLCQKRTGEKKFDMMLL
jgi:hypothetical protein